MIRVRWTPQARNDLRSIHDYISHDSLQYAALVVGELLGAVRRLNEFPQSGRIVPERGDPVVREVIWRNYRIIYRYLSDVGEVHVLLVLRAGHLFPGVGV